MDNSVKLAGLWKQKAKGTGQQFLSGPVGPGSKLVIFKNTQKKSEKSPDFTAYLVSVPKREAGKEGKKEAEDAPF